MTRHWMIGAAVLALAAAGASADTLREALVMAYRTNPTLTGQRETLKVSDANVAIAKAAGRPTVSGTLGVNRDLTQSGVFNRGGSKGPYLTGGVDISYPLFNGGSTRNSIVAAKTRVEAGRATLRAVEGDVFTDAVAAYMDVIRDRAIVELNGNNVKVLQTNLRATSDQYKIGELTRTDVAQSQARLEDGQARLATAQGTLKGSEENYRRVIGQAPGMLQPPPPLPPLPATADEAARIALANNPDLISITAQAKAAGYDVSAARGARLPTINAVGSGDYSNTLAGDVTGPRAGTATSIGVSARIPLYQGGLPAARIRSAQAQEGQLLESRVGTERAVVATARSAFASYQAAQLSISANEESVKANELALEGARAERTVGTRTVLDVLNAEQELLQSQVNLVTAKRNAYVAGFQLLNAMGQAEAGRLGLDGGPLYDPLGNYRRVAGEWNDWAGDPRHAPVATSTVTDAERPQDVTAAP